MLVWKSHLKDIEFMKVKTLFHLLYEAKFIQVFKYNKYDKIVKELPTNQKCLKFFVAPER